MIFLREATQNDHIKLLYKFENDQKNFGCVGSCGYAPASVKMFDHKNLVEKFLLTSLASLLLTSTAFYSDGNQFVADIIVRQK